jgi:uncharacterized protein YdhG (YjbR/CyaY superfamily)
MPEKLITLHNRILKKRMTEIEAEIRAKAPEIQAEKMINNFRAYVNECGFRERFRIFWRILRGKL